MVSSEPNSIKAKAISKSQFYYTATCLTSLNLLRFVGTSTVSNDLQLSWAHEYSMAVLQMLPVKTFFRLTPLGIPALLVFNLASVFHQCFIPQWSQLVGAGVDNYCLIKRFNSRRQTQPTLPTTLPLNEGSWNWLLRYLNVKCAQFIWCFCS